LSPTTACADDQLEKLNNINEKQRQKLLQFLEIQDRLQRTAAEMNTLRSTATASLDVEGLSQQLSQMPGNLLCHQSLPSPLPHRTKRSRFDLDQMDQMSKCAFPLQENSDLVNRSQEREPQRNIHSSVTQDEEVLSPTKEPLQIRSEVSGLSFEHPEFSQIEV
jgi:hypothetical protein